jgi:replicative DNA helicase
MEDHIYDPYQVQDLTIQVVSDRVIDPRGGIETGIQPLDNVLLPMRPGELIGVLGYTSNFKTGLMNNVARYHAKRIREENLGPQAVIRFDWEMSVEEQGIIDLAQATQIDATRMIKGDLSIDEWDELKKAANDRAKLPLWLVGHSSEGSKRRPRMSLADIATAMRYIVDECGIVPALVLVDYLQRIRRVSGETMREGFIDVVDGIKDIGLQYHCPMMLGCQAKRDVKRRAWRMPRADDAQETSNFEQTCDKLVGVWLTKNDFAIGTQKKFGTKTYTVTNNQLLINIIKQKFGISPYLLETYVKYETAEIHLVSHEEE